MSKRYKELKSLITKESYSLEEGISLIKSFQTVNFEESVEGHFFLNINPKQTNQQIRASIILPNGSGKSFKIGAFTEDPEKAITYGANVAGFEDLFNDISRGIINFDVLITTPALMPKLAKLGKILGPKSLMPSPKAGTVTENIEVAIKEFKKGKIEYRSDKTGIVHFIFGKTSFPKEALIENLKTIYASIEKNKSTSIKGKYFKSIHICTTMSPSVCIDLASLKI